MAVVTIIGMPRIASVSLSRTTKSMERRLLP
jgi:hypothetical protein